MWRFLGVSEGKITHTLRRGPHGPVLSLVYFSYPSAQIFCGKEKHDHAQAFLGREEPIGT